MNARARVGHNSGNTDDYFDEDEGDPRKISPPSTELVAQHIAKITKAENERKRAAQIVSEAKKAAINDGIEPAILAHMLRLNRMDAEDREDFLHKLDAYATALKYW